MSDVLIVDDDALLCEFMAKALRAKGLDVITAGDGDTALALLHELGARVLVADKHLDRGRVKEDGHALAEAAARRYPTLGVVYITGDPGALTGRALTARERALFKPFFRNELVAAVLEVLTD